MGCVFPPSLTKEISIGLPLAWSFTSQFASDDEYFWDISFISSFENSLFRIQDQFCIYRYNLVFQILNVFLILILCQIYN